MNAEKRKQPEVGDRGQRYEIWCDDENGQPMQMGWANKPDAMKRAVELHPCWSNHRAVDRWGAAAPDSRAASDADGARSCPAPGSAPSWEDCERKFREMRSAFGVDREKWKRLDAEYREMLAAFERTEEKGPNDPSSPTESA